MGFPQLYRPHLAPPIQITGFTRDSTGTILPGCLVKAYATATDIVASSAVSDANGYFSLPVSGGVQYYLVAYLVGSPDVEGTTVNTLTGSQ